MRDRWWFTGKPKRQLARGVKTWAGNPWAQVFPTEPPGVPRSFEGTKALSRAGLKSTFISNEPAVSSLVFLPLILANARPSSDDVAQLLGKAAWASAAKRS